VGRPEGSGVEVGRTGDEAEGKVEEEAEGKVEEEVEGCGEEVGRRENDISKRDDCTAAELVGIGGEEVKGANMMVSSCWEGETEENGIEEAVGITREDEGEGGNEVVVVVLLSIIPPFPDPLPACTKHWSQWAAGLVTARARGYVRYSISYFLTCHLSKCSC
jgi:uncharacterized protein YjbJ (UPF0337 family)